MAPPFIACTDIGMSPCPVMKMIGSRLFATGELPLKIKTALPRKSHVEDQANGTVRRILLEKIGDGGEKLSFQANRSQQTPNRGSKIRIVVDDQDGKLSVRHRAAQVIAEISHCFRHRFGICSRGRHLPRR